LHWYQLPVALKQRGLDKLQFGIGEIGDGGVHSAFPDDGADAMFIFAGDK